MRYLYLLRHAEAAKPAGVEDKHRPLTPRGMADALALGQLMKAKGYTPDLTICSPARRTQQTLRKIQESLGELHALLPPAAYYATTGQLYDLMKQLDNKKKSVLLISHNPSIHGLARFLAGIGSEESMASLSTQYRECTLSVFECAIDGWSDLMPSANDFADLLIPGRDFGQSSR